MKRLLAIISSLFFALAFFSIFPKCAQVKPPTGGPKDTIPPILILSNPPNKTINYKGRSFLFEFNERIKLDKFKKQLIITPRIESKYEFKLKKNSFTLNFEKDFENNTTYTFNFREGIKDLTEGNVTPDNKFVFSTGDYIDSLSISGTITHLFTGDTLKQILVGLYNMDGDTITILNGSPYYFTETDKKGFYSLENIINGVYKIYAFKDGNKNLKLETKTETYSFLSDTIYLSQNITNLNLQLYNLDIRDYKVQTSMPSGQYYYINFNKYIFSYSIQPINNDLRLYSGFAKEHRSIKIYNTFHTKDSIEVFYQATDSINNVIKDTIWVKFKESNRKYDEFKLQTTPGSGSITEQFDLSFNFSKPVLYTNTDSLFFQFDTTAIKYFNEDSLYLWNDRSDELTIPVYLNKSLADTVLAQRIRFEKIKADSLKTSRSKKGKSEKPAKKQMSSKNSKNKKTELNKGLQLYLGTGTFISIENDTLKPITNNYAFSDLEKFGSISGKVKTDYPGYFIQLIDTNNNLVDEQHNVNSYTFTMVPPGNYKIRVLIDNNGNGKWDPGNMLLNIEPEEIMFFPKIISIRANWELNQNLRF